MKPEGKEFGKKKNGENLLDYVPRRKRSVTWELNQDGRVVLRVCHKGLYAQIAHYLFAAPLTSFVELEEKGTLIWQWVNGKRSLYEIETMLEREVGETSLSDFVLYISVLNRQGLIDLLKPIC